MEFSTIAVLALLILLIILCAIIAYHALAANDIDALKKAGRFSRYLDRIERPVILVACGMSVAIIGVSAYEYSIDVKAEDLDPKLVKEVNEYMRQPLD